MPKNNQPTHNMPMSIKRNILLNPGPATTSDSVKFAQVVPDICPREKEFGEMVDWIQTQLVSFAGSIENNVCVLIGGSGTAAVEMTINSVIPEDGGLLVINQGAYGERILKIASVYNIATVEFSSSNYECIDYTALEQSIEKGKQTLQSLNKTLTHIVAVHHETTSGLLSNLSAIGNIADKHKLSLIVDAMSSYGAMPISMDNDNIDYLISSSNKNIQGMAGIGIVICNKQAIESTSTISKKSLYLNLYDQYAYFLKTKQFRFTPPVQTMYALKQAIDETLAETIEVRYKRYIDSYKTLRTGMEQLGFRVLVSDDISSGFITTFFDPKDESYSFDSMHDYLYERGFTIYPGKVSQANTFRIANIGDIDTNDMAQFLVCLQAYINEYHISVIL